MNHDADVTVVIPTHNRRQLLLRTLTSVLDQRNVRLNVVVVDDGGADGTSRAIQALDRPNVRVLRHEHAKGVSAARNAGLATVDTAWVAFVDDDDLWSPDKLTSQLSALATHRDARWSCVGAVHVDSAMHLRRYNRPPPTGSVATALRTRNVVPGGGSGVLVETDLARHVGGFDENMSIAADWDFYFRLSREAPLAAVDQPLLAYYVHTDSMLHDPRRYLREFAHMRSKYEGLPTDETLDLDPVFWTFRLAGMARKLGDRKAVLPLLRWGVSEAGWAPVTAELARRVSRRFRRQEDGPVETIQPVTWLSKYAPLPG